MSDIIFWPVEVQPFKSFIYIVFLVVVFCREK